MRPVLIAAALLAAVSIANAADVASKRDDGASAAYMQAMEDMNKKMNAMKPTGNADADFAMMMSMHHQSAVDMAEAYLQRGADPQLKAMAQKIIADQKREIAEFQKWQQKSKE